MVDYEFFCYYSTSNSTKAVTNQTHSQSDVQLLYLFMRGLFNWKQQIELRYPQFYVVSVF